jgi:hypothetical protein
LRASARYAARSFHGAAVSCQIPATSVRAIIYAQRRPSSSSDDSPRTRRIRDWHDVGITSFIIHSLDWQAFNRCLGACVLGCRIPVQQANRFANTCRLLVTYPHVDLVKIDDSGVDRHQRVYRCRTTSLSPIRKTRDSHHAASCSSIAGVISRS